LAVPYASPGFSVGRPWEEREIIGQAIHREKGFLATSQFGGISLIRSPAENLIPR
jgi:hypothetical protein